MSKQTIINNMSRLQKEIDDIVKKLSQETKKENDCNKRILQINNSISKNTNQSMLKNKNNEIQRKNDEIVKVQNRKADLSKKKSEKTKQLNNYKIQLEKEEEKERKKLEVLEKKRAREQLAAQKQITKELEIQKRLSSELDIKGKKMALNENVEYDIFISHAWEDKEDFVRPLAEELEKMGFRVWYDEITLKVGDSLREKIDQGLSNSRYGTVILSSSFFSKNWTQYELNAMVAREMDGHKMILPIWHKVSKSEVLKFSPTLADKVALNSSLNSVEEIAQQLSEVLKEEA
jgi:hypothetical protein